MSQITTSPLRQGNFTSSEIVALTTSDKSGKNFGAPAKTYIAEKNLERLLGVSLDTEVEVFALLWGKTMEERIFNMPTFDPKCEYTITSDVTIKHPTIDFWAGSPDGFREIQERTIYDFKAPSTRKSFALLSLPTVAGLTGLEAMYAIRDGFVYKDINIPAHKDGAKYYWQLVSNACITGCDYAELIAYMPFDSELLDIKNSVGDDDRFRWMLNKDIASLPDGGLFNNINVTRFKIPQADKDFLTERVLAAGELLINPMQMEHTFDLQAMKEANG